MPLLLVLLSFVSFAFAGFDKVTIKNLELAYSAPHGKGTVEKVTLGFSLAPEIYPIEVNRTADSFELMTPFLDVAWRNPWKFFHDLEKLETRKFNLSAGGTKHTLSTPYLSMQPQERGEYKAENVSASCEGTFTGKLDIRLFEDCREKMNVVAKRFDVPTDFILYRILHDAPSVPREIDVPTYDLEFNSKKGDYSLFFTFKYIFLARLRAYGHFQYENNYKTIAIRVDQVKFGYLPVTSFVLRRLKEINTNPNVTVDPPWIRINVGNDEGQSN
ncbi:hypothetical protein [Peredibacter starrii]|uniref:Uncharacterized protein n=1 Tax=Peredibacter starrii TaxID=28202 RepID=A0AAX4HJB5_9BACT|nr:hypothetical protein [Peredibacter starrii]WPU63316.1 hypothetical protein SOO65_11530 [Peredibacter starrii]